MDVRFVRELFSAARGGPAIISASEDAWKVGVRAGMPLAEARSMAEPLTSPKARTTQSETLFFEWSPDDDRRSLCEIAELTRRFAPIVGLDETPVPDSLLLDITGCGPLFGGESSLAEQLVHRLQKHQLHCQAAISDSVASSWAFAHSSGHFLQQSATARGGRTQTIGSDWDLPVVVIPPGQAETWLHKLPVAAGRIPLRDAELLAQLGILNIRQLLSLPLQDLPSRLSDHAITRIHQLGGIEDELITAIPEANPVAATWASEFAAKNQAEIRQIVEHLTTEVVEQLVRRGVGAIRLTCQLRNEQRTEFPVIAEVIRPLQSAEEFIEVLKLRLDAMRISDPIFSASMHACTAMLPVARQKDLFSTTEHIEPAEELATVVNRLSNRLGKRAVLTVTPSEDPVPEKSVQLQPLFEPGDSIQNIEDRLEDLTTPLEQKSHRESPANRPLRLLSPPQLIASEKTDPLRQPFAWNGTTYATTAVTNPERIQTQWWHDSPVHRDYFRISTDGGSEFWIFQDLNTGHWFLHGLFE